MNNIKETHKSKRLSHSYPKAHQACRYILEHIGDDPAREGLIETPARMILAWQELFSGYETDIAKLFKTFSEGSCKEMVILKHIDFYSTCEHHFLPFFGNVSIGYLPNKKVIGVSKLARLVQAYSRRLQIQENMTSQIADALMNNLNCKGVIVVAQAQHLCMVSRGVKNTNASMTTSAVRGIFENDTAARNEFLQLIKE